MGKCQIFMLSLCRQTDRQTDGWTTVKQYAPDLSIWGHKNLLIFMYQTSTVSFNPLPDDKILDCKSYFDIY